MSDLPSLPPVLSPALTDREAIADAGYRAQLSVDIADREMFESAFTSDATLYFNDMPACTGLESINAMFFDTVSKLDTQHTLLNVRINIDSEKKARLTGMGNAMHFRTKQGTEHGAQYFVAGTKHHMVLVKQDGLWKIEEWKIRTLWNDGEEGIIWGK